MSETKQKFFDAYTKPVSSMYSTVIIELLVQQHFVRYNKNYMYNMVRFISMPQTWCMAPLLALLLAEGQHTGPYLGRLQHRGN